MKYRYLVGAIALVMLFSSTLFSASSRFQGYDFKAQVIKANGQKYREFTENNRATLKVRPNEEYSIVVYNPLPVRVGVAVSIDGLNTIDGQRTTPRNARKWMIDPKSSITVSGWQTSKETMRKFVFTRDEEAYASWRGEKEGKPYARNMGVIGVAWFWNKAELDEALHPPQPFAEEMAVKAPSAARRGAPAPSAAKAPARAGTGMGQEQRHRVTQVEFNPDAGMFSVKDVLKIFYEFAKEPPEPMPFVDPDQEQNRFAPDMHK